MNEKRMIKND